MSSSIKVRLTLPSKASKSEKGGLTEYGAVDVKLSSDSLSVVSNSGTELQESPGLRGGG